MIRRIILSFLIFDLLLAMAIYLYWVSASPIIQPHTISLGNDFLAFLKSCNTELNDFKIAIPTIPDEGLVNGLVVATALTNPFVALLNAFVIPVSGLVRILNMVIQFLNTLISLFQFIFIVLKNLIAFKDGVVLR